MYFLSPSSSSKDWLVKVLLPIVPIWLNIFTMSSQWEYKASFWYPTCHEKELPQNSKMSICPFLTVTGNILWELLDHSRRWYDLLLVNDQQRHQIPLQEYEDISQYPHSLTHSLVNIHTFPVVVLIRFPVIVFPFVYCYYLCNKEWPSSSFFHQYTFSIQSALRSSPTLQQFYVLWVCERILWSFPEMLACSSQKSQTY